MQWKCGITCQVVETALQCIFDAGKYRHYWEVHMWFGKTHGRLIAEKLGNGLRTCIFHEQWRIAVRQCLCKTNICARHGCTRRSQLDRALATLIKHNKNKRLLQQRILAKKLSALFYDFGRPWINEPLLTTLRKNRHGLFEAPACRAHASHHVVAVKRAAWLVMRPLPRHISFAQNLGEIAWSGCSSHMIIWPKQIMKFGGAPCMHRHAECTVCHWSSSKRSNQLCITGLEWP